MLRPSPDVWSCWGVDGTVRHRQTKPSEDLPDVAKRRSIRPDNIFAGAGASPSQVVDERRYGDIEPDCTIAPKQWSTFCSTPNGGFILGAIHEESLIDSRDGG